MQPDCFRLISDYASWISSHSVAVASNGGCKISTPFLDRHADQIQIYVDPLPSGSLLVSDDGWALRDLETSGFRLEGERRNEALAAILRRFGVELREDELTAEADPETFPQKKHDLVQAMLAVSDLHVMAQAAVAATFFDDVAVFLENNDVRFTPELKLTGRSGLAQSFDFAIPRSHAQPERVLRVISTPSRANFVELMFAWEDVRESRAPGARAFAVINDQERAPSADHLTALNAYGVENILWTEREKHLRVLQS